MKTYIIEFEDDKEINFAKLQTVILNLQSDHKAQVKKYGNKVALICWTPGGEPEEAKIVNVNA